MKLEWLQFWIAGLAAYRITVLIARDLGPFGIFKWLRARKRLGGLASCPYCVSVYTGCFTAISLWGSDVVMPIPLWILLALALSSVAIILDRTFSSDYVAK